MCPLAVDNCIALVAFDEKELFMIQESRHIFCVLNVEYIPNSFAVWQILKESHTQKLISSPQKFATSLSGNSHQVCPLWKLLCIKT